MNSAERAKLERTVRNFDEVIETIATRLQRARRGAFTRAGRYALAEADAGLARLVEIVRPSVEGDITAVLAREARSAEGEEG